MMLTLGGVIGTEETADGGANRCNKERELKLIQEEL